MSSRAWKLSDPQTKETQKNPHQNRKVKLLKIKENNKAFKAVRYSVLPMEENNLSENGFLIRNSGGRKE